MDEDLTVRVREIVADVVELDLQPDDDILRSGRLDSLGLVELIAAIEQELGASVSLTDLDIEDFRTVRSIADFLSYQAGLHDGTRNPVSSNSGSTSPLRDFGFLAAASEQEAESQS